MEFICPIPKLTIASGGDKTIAELTAGTNHELRILDLQLFFFGTDTVQAPIEVQAGRASAGGTATSDNPIKMRAGPTNDFTYENAHSANATFDTDEPGLRWGVHPQTGLMMPFVKPFILGSGEIFQVLIKDPGTSTDLNGFLIVEE